MHFVSHATLPPPLHDVVLMASHSRMKRGHDEVVVTYFARQSSETALLITQLVHHRRTNVFDKFALHYPGTVTHYW